MKKCTILIPILFSGCQGIPVTIGVEYEGSSISVKWGGKSPVLAEPTPDKSPISPMTELESYLPTKNEPNGKPLDALKPETGLSKISRKIKELFQ